MKEIWESRYAEDEYIYGTEPNRFFKEFIDANSPCKILLPAEGEGRNAVYAALKGWEVVAFDQSEQARIKALKLAEKNHVTIDYTVKDIFDFNYPEESFDAIGLIYLHLPSEIKKPALNKLFSFLKPEGKVIMEVFHKEQLKNTSGGPKIEDLLYDIEELEDIFLQFNFSKFEKYNILLDEGKLHQGNAEVIRIEAMK
jgi:ubiquinone/menaquinone biosynthesis C-methylase UbiE